MPVSWSCTPNSSARCIRSFEDTIWPLKRYEDVAQRTTEIIKTLPDLDTEQRLPEAPWFKPGAAWSAGRVLLHLIAETAQHAGHAEIIPESLDGAKTMG